MAIFLLELVCSYPYFAVSCFKLAVIKLEHSVDHFSWCFMSLIDLAYLDYARPSSCVTVEVGLTGLY